MPGSVVAFIAAAMFACVLAILLQNCGKYASIKSYDTNQAQATQIAKLDHRLDAIESTRTPRP